MKNKFKATAGALTLFLCVSNISLAHAQATSDSSTPDSVMKSQGCDPTIASQMSSAQMAQINGRTNLATKILKEALSGLDYNTASCLTNLLGLVPHLSIPSAGDIENQFDNFVCNETQQLASPYVNDIAGGLSSLTGKLNGFLYQNMSLGSVGGMNFGTIPFGVTLAGGSNGSSGQIANLADMYSKGYSKYLGGDPTQPAGTSVYVSGFNNYMEQAQGLINGNN